MVRNGRMYRFKDRSHVDVVPPHLIAPFGSNLTLKVKTIAVGLLVRFFYSCLEPAVSSWAPQIDVDVFGHAKNQPRMGKTMQD
ncbi:hypothetical protein Agabi119p4_7937 [Agaricus bisporus var. burnettii]|uniref:Uncharacterized protein n=1 Tax=Agaricus bisporus var. burnettii TaxID=192524 RepID=A0A8H7EZE4_AGABI|nr:hypothetical protein Agabi119p4_7937 [Agaricus bisporus var. burnettii]